MDLSQQPPQGLKPQIAAPVPNEEPHAATPEESRAELREAIRDSNQILATATTVFEFFPDTLVVDRAKITVTKRQFFSVAEVMSIRIEDILNVTVMLGPLFGSVKIVTRVMTAGKPYLIGRFWRKDALRVKRVTQGYIIALQRGIDCSSLPTTELSVMLEKLGEDDHAA